MTEMDDTLSRFDAEVAELETSLSGATSMAATFQGELREMQGTMLYTGREVNAMSRSLGGGLRRAFDGVVVDGLRLSDALQNVASSMIDAAYNTALQPVQNAVGSAVGNGVNSLLGNLLPFEKGGAIGQGRVMPFARGGVVSSPTTFPMRGGTGLMGEAGPEAIMPLRRGPDGKLGVAAGGGGGGPVNITMNISSPDVAGFQRSSAQVAAQMQRALARGQRNR